MNGPSTLWNNLCSTAVLGTDRTGACSFHLDGKIAAFLENHDSTETTAHFLRTTAAVSVYCRAGAAQFDARIGIADFAPVDQGVATASAGRMLRQILDDGPLELLVEWCRLAARADVGAPDELLPSLLERWVRNPDSPASAAITSALGHRGRWLARKNPQWWSAIFPFEEPEHAWQTGTIDQRARALRCLRARDPGSAREWLMAAWNQEAPTDRSKLLMQLEEGLDPGDESFLEIALDERTVGIRRIATALLSRLPGSRFSDRMATRTTALVTIKCERGLLRRRATVEVILPEPGDKELGRDGVEFKAKGNLGTKAHALVQMIASTPLSTWENQAGIEPKAIVAAAKNTEWVQVFSCGWSAAAAWQRNALWSEALLTDFFIDAHPKAEEFGFEVVPELLLVLEPSHRERIVSQAVKNGRWESPAVQALVRGCDHDWSSEFSLALLAALRKHLRQTKGAFDDGLRRLVASWVTLRLSPWVADDAAVDWPVHEPYWTRWLEEMIDGLTSTLRFRKQLHEEFRS